MILRGKQPRFAAACLALVLATVAHAHSKLESAEPKSGSTLERSPASIEIRFRDAVRLTSVTLVSGQDERMLSFAPKASARQFTVDAPALASGRNEVRWKALSRDGHVIEGVLVYQVASAAAKD
jgi:copper resistance protein C